MPARFKFDWFPKRIAIDEGLNEATRNRWVFNPSKIVLVLPAFGQAEAFLDDKRPACPLELDGTAAGI